MEKEIISERIVNIEEVEDIMRRIHLMLQYLKDEVKKEKPSIERINGLSEIIDKDCQSVKDFDFRIEARKINFKY